MLSRLDFFIRGSYNIMFSGGGGDIFPIDETGCS